VSALLEVSGSYLANRRLSWTTRQATLSGFFFETGVKNLATAFSSNPIYQA